MVTSPLIHSAEVISIWGAGVTLAAGGQGGLTLAILISSGEIEDS